MKCACKHEVNSHLYNSKLGCYNECLECDCEGFDPSTEEDITELEF